MDRIALAAWLYEQPSEAVCAISDKIEGWEPVRGCCHANADQWAELNPGFTAVRGWLRGAHVPPPPDGDSFISHSVVAGPSGTLFEVTYTAADGSYPFIRHPWDEAEFLAEVANNGMPHIEHRLSDKQHPAPTFDPPDPSDFPHSQF